MPQTLNDILAGFSRSPYAPRGSQPDSNRLLSALIAGQQPAAPAAASSLSPEEEAALAEAYPDYQPIEPPKKPSVLMRIIEGTAPPAYQQRISEREKLRQQIELANQTGPAEAKQARAQARLKLLAARRGDTAEIEARKSLAEMKAQEEAKAEQAKREQRDLEDIRKLRQTASEKFGVKNAHSLPVNELMDAISAQSAKQLEEESAAKKAETARKKRELSSEDKVAVRQQETEHRKSLEETRNAILQGANAVSSIAGKGRFRFEQKDRDGNVIATRDLTLEDVKRDAKDQAEANGLTGKDVDAIVKYATEVFARRYTRVLRQTDEAAAAAKAAGNQ